MAVIVTLVFALFVQAAYLGYDVRALVRRPRRLRWPPAQPHVPNAAHRMKARPYLSGAEPYRLYVWPKSTFWTAIALVIAVTIMICVAADRSSRAGALGHGTG